MIRPQNPSSVTLAQLAAQFALVAHAQPGWEEIAVTGVCADNRQILPGEVFLAVPGARVHGAIFADAAIAAGAAAVITDRAGVELIAADIPVLESANLDKELGNISAAILGNPAQQLSCYGVTGTNGKTTIAFMIDYALRQLGRRSGLSGTVVLRLLDEEITAQLTTPQPADLQMMLARLVELGGQDFVMEVSSHALAQGRTRPIKFDIAGFSNLSQDHLDYHHGLSDYFAAKAQLFDSKNSRRAVITVDDTWGRKLAEMSAAARPHATAILAVFTELPEHDDAVVGWQVKNIAITATGSSFQLVSTDGRELAMHTKLPGDFNVANAALALVMLLEAGFTPAELTAALHGEISPVIPGRMEVVGTAPRVVVDFAHNEAALRKAIGALRDTTAGKLIVVTGSAGERDKEKRPLMARAVCELADMLVVTDDDPHSEDPAQIRQDLISGIPLAANWVEIADREQAIQWAILQAQPEDTVLLAGRGHETVQEVGGHSIQIDDRVVARAALASREAGATQ
ncbi:MAG: UDP-N-acetylmuramoyl-L-alanyl-D-glutamate--2,6-diaminopimelate ligase [Trueperella sp.]|nr:UDP-N-acetylmuramoyl-L-alanyl-D-glutamate--2,6-diaminopimelate ligase [Trueperella sp.]